MNPDDVRIIGIEFITAQGYRAELHPHYNSVVELRYYDSHTNTTYRS